MRFTLVLALLTIASGRLSAQAVELQLREEGSGRVVAGAIVRLLDERGAVAAQGLSGESGRIALRAARGGTYRLKVDRIGWASVTAGPYTLGPGETLRRDLLLSSERRNLPMIEVQGTSRCEGATQGGPLAAALWEEIHKALTASILSDAGELEPLHLKEFARDVDLAGTLVRERTIKSMVLPGHRYAALPAEVLDTGGFVLMVGDRSLYAAPDARLLLSDAFVNGHCFRAVPGVGDRVGLAFVPNRDRKVAEVQGTLWVNRNTSELDVLEYTYTGLPRVIAASRAGGRVAFQRLPNGQWIVNDWFIRRPLLQRFHSVSRTSDRIRVDTTLTGYHERGARVALATDSLGQPTRGFIRGRVYDSITGGGLEDVDVYLERSHDSIVTDENGDFEMAVAALGAQTLTANHWKLGLPGSTTSRTLTIVAGETREAEFAVPSVASLGSYLCGSSSSANGVVGIVFAADSTPAAGITVRIQWRNADGVQMGSRVDTDSAGLFAVCRELPPYRAMPLRFFRGEKSLVQMQVKVEPAGYTWVEMRVPK